MKRIVAFCLANLLSIYTYASMSPIVMPKKDPWGFGVGFGMENNYDSTSLMEIKSPTIFTFLRGTNKVSLVLALENKEIDGNDFEVTPIHLLFEISSNPYKELIRPYLRLGAGTVLINDTRVYPTNSYFNTQFQVGADFITGYSETGLASSFFIQAMMNFPAIRNPPLGSQEIFDGTTMALGLRLYF